MPVLPEQCVGDLVLQFRFQQPRLDLIVNDHLCGRHRTGREGRAKLTTELKTASREGRERGVGDIFTPAFLPSQRQVLFVWKSLLDIPLAREHKHFHAAWATNTHLLHWDSLLLFPTCHGAYFKDQGKMVLSSEMESPLSLDFHEDAITLLQVPWCSQISTQKNFYQIQQDLSSPCRPPVKPNVKTGRSPEDEPLIKSFACRTEVTATGRTCSSYHRMYYVALLFMESPGEKVSSMPAHCPSIPSFLLPYPRGKRQKGGQTYEECPLRSKFRMKLFPWWLEFMRCPLKASGSSYLSAGNFYLC